MYIYTYIHVCVCSVYVFFVCKDGVNVTERVLGGTTRRAAEYSGCVYVYLRKCMCVYIYTYMHERVLGGTTRRAAEYSGCVYVYYENAFIYIYIYVYIHTHTHIHTYVCFL